jgi:hypothetical protein
LNRKSLIFYGAFFYFFTMDRKLLVVLAVFLNGCIEDKYAPENFLNKEELHKIISQTVRYSEKRAPGSTHESKFDTAFNWYYDAAIKEYDVRRYYISDNQASYFLFTRVARSIVPMREAIGGRLVVDDQMNLKEYEEIFRTWKMSEDSLNTRAFQLFERMVNNEDLSRFGPKHQGDRYIEFPNERFYFDKARMRWIDSIMDSVYNRSAN